MRDAERIAAIVNEWFQGEPTPERQQNMRRTTLINELVAVVTEARNDWYASNRVIHRLHAEMDELRAKVAEEIAQAIEAAAWGNDDRYDQAIDRAAEIAREHGKES